MDISVYNKLFEAFKDGLAAFNERVDYNVALEKFAPLEPKYPLILLAETRNKPYRSYYGSREQISSLTYNVEIYTQTQKGKNKVDLAREIMQYTVDFFQNKLGFNLTSYNYFDGLGSQGELYRIVLVFDQNYFENKETFL